MKKGLSEFAIGGISGIAGAGAMLIIILIAKLFGLVNIPFPLLVERRLEEKTGTSGKTDQKDELLIALGLHFSLGAFYGILYSLLQKLVRLPGYFLGPVFGLTTFLVDEVAMGPALGLTPKPEQMSPVTFWRRVLIKFVFGLTLFLAFDRIRSWASSNNRRTDFIL